MITCIENIQGDSRRKIYSLHVDMPLLASKIPLLPESPEFNSDWVLQLCAIDHKYDSCHSTSSF